MCRFEKSRTTCRGCGAIHETEEKPWTTCELSFYDTKIVPHEYALERLFSESLLPEVVDSWKCDDCGPVGCTREQIICNWPQVLCVRIKRFNWTAFGVQKKSHEVSFPEFLDEMDDRPKYRLRSICVHSGAALHEGHYTSCVRTDEGWFFCDDDRQPRKITVAEVLSKKQVYGLFYERQ